MQSKPLEGEVVSFDAISEEFRFQMAAHQLAQDAAKRIFSVHGNPRLPVGRELRTLNETALNFWSGGARGARVAGDERLARYLEAVCVFHVCPSAFYAVQSMAGLMANCPTVDWLNSMANDAL